MGIHSLTHSCKASTVHSLPIRSLSCPDKPLNTPNLSACEAAALEKCLAVPPTRRSRRTRTPDALVLRLPLLPLQTHSLDQEIRRLGILALLYPNSTVAPITLSPRVDLCNLSSSVRCQTTLLDLPEVTAVLNNAPSSLKTHL